MEQDSNCISWKSLPWTLFKRKIFHLQCKIYEAKKRGNFRLVRRLQKLLIHSKSAHFIATKLLVNCCDKYKLSDYEKITLAYSIRYSLRNDFSTNKFRLCESHKSLEFGKVSVIQYILRLVLEPLYYEKPNWILVRDDEKLNVLIERISLQIQRVSNLGLKKVLRFEINSCLRENNYKLFIKQVNLPLKHKLFLYKSLKMSWLDSHGANNGLIDFLRDVLIDGINDSYFFDKGLLTCRDRFKVGKSSFTYSNTVVYFLKQDYALHSFVDALKTFLSKNGLVIKLSSISVSTLREGFDFFNWFFKKPISKKIIISLSESSLVLYKKLFKSILSKNYSSSFKMRKIILLHMNWIQKHRYISKFRLKTTFYYLKRLIFKSSKTLKFLEKKILFKSFRFNIPSSF